MSNIRIWDTTKLLFVQTHFNVKTISGSSEEVSSAIYLQVSIISQALIFVTRSQGWSFLERPGALLMVAFVVAQLVSICYGMICHFFAYTLYFRCLIKFLTNAFYFLRARWQL